jgi:hypothetical protein
MIEVAWEMPAKTRRPAARKESRTAALISRREPVESFVMKYLFSNRE